MELGARITERLEVLRISQAELARRAEIPQSTVNSLIRKNRRSSPHILRIARELRTTAAYLTGETDDPEGDFSDEPLTSEERELLDLFRGLEEKERSAFITLARSLATNARSPTVHAKGLGYRAQEGGAAVLGGDADG